ncbi:MAG TPA: hypothetical protein VKB80_16405 [Kofleriaceae bacterium]|nr:hypothetical protein [Kofleriaceae bacterium]
MRRASLFPLLLVLATVSGCDKGGDKRGMPSSQSWKPPAPQASEVDQTGGAVGRSRGGSHGAGEGDDQGAGAGAAPDDEGGVDPHAGMQQDGGVDPHAGLDMSGGEAEGEAAGGEEDPKMASIESPDPDRPIDANKYLRGTIRADAKVAAGIRPGAVLFLSAWPIDPASGEVTGSPVAVARLDVSRLPMPFELSERDAMAAGTRFEGDVLISARIDGDAEARTKEPGDVEGQLRAHVPAKGLDLVLDSLLR